MHVKLRSIQNTRLRRERLCLAPSTAQSLAFCTGAAAVLVTGATGGLGEAVARALARQGWDVVLSGRRLDRLASIAQQINRDATEREEEAQKKKEHREAGGGDGRRLGRAVAIPADVASEAEQKRLFRDAALAFPRLTGVVACAAIEGTGVDFLQDPNAIAEAEAIFKTNVIGSLITLREAICHFRARNAQLRVSGEEGIGCGTIILISSGAGALAPQYTTAPHQEQRGRLNDSECESEARQLDSSAKNLRSGEEQRSEGGRADCAMRHWPQLSAMSLCYGPSKSAIDQIVRSCGVLARPDAGRTTRFPKKCSLPGESETNLTPTTTAATTAIEAIASPDHRNASVPIRVFAVAPHVYRTEMACRVASEMGLTIEKFAQLANPIYPGVPGDPADFARVLCSLLDGSSRYLPGDLIYCDNDATYLASARYSRLYSRTPSSEAIEPSEVRDYRGDLGFNIRRRETRMPSGVDESRQ